MKHASCIAILIIALLATASVPALAEVEFTEHVVDDDFAGAQDVCAADMDFDDDVDFIACGYFSNQVVWYECTAPNTWDPHIVDYNCEGAWCVVPVDLDQDGDMDLMSAAFLGDEVCWYENDGNMNFTEHFITYSDGPESIQPVDLDQDGDLDVVVADYFGDAVRWVENDGATNWTLHLVSGVVDGACFIFPVDLDEDGDVDIMAAARHGHTMIWFENDGNQSFAQYTIAGYYSGARCIWPVDMDDDGDLDALCAAGDGGTVDWFEHTPQMDWPQHQIENSLMGAWYAMPADVDNDGDWDVVGSGYIDNRVAWWENDGTALGWTEHVVSNSFNGAQTVRACDADQDGLIDILGAAYLNNDIIWWEQVQSPIVLDLTPATEPVIVPRGQAFAYNLMIESFVEVPVTAYFWTSAVLPSGNTFGPVYSTQIPFTPGLTIVVNQIQQMVPNFAPLGEYQWVANIGPNPNQPAYISDSFPFTVVAPTVTGMNSTATGWATNGNERILEALNGSPVASAKSSIPDAFSLSSAWPNPFNPSTTLTLDLPESAELTVAVYNVTGQQVAELAHGSYAAGSHTLTFDAANLSAGVYFVRASAGPWNAVRKIVLLK